MVLNACNMCVIVAASEDPAEIADISPELHLPVTRTHPRVGASTGLLLQSHEVTLQGGVHCH